MIIALGLVMRYRDKAEKVFKVEAETILALIEQLDENFDLAVQLLLESKGKLVVTGMGKSGIIGKKISATLSSTGTQAFFMHPGEAYHGDLGVVDKRDVFLALSNSGETDEVIKLVPFIKSNGNKLISITGNSASTLAKESNYHLLTQVKKEACPLQLAPTASTTAALAMGDALAVSLMEARDFKPENFARFHPGGSLGKRLLMKVSDVMTTGQLPIVSPEKTYFDLVHAMTEGRLGLAIVIKDNVIKGIVTDGDLRRAAAKLGPEIIHVQARDIMGEHPKTIDSKALQADAAQIMDEEKISSLIVTTGENVLGVVQRFNCIR